MIHCIWFKLHSTKWHRFTNGSELGKREWIFLKSIWRSEYMWICCMMGFYFDFTQPLLKIVYVIQVFYFRTSMHNSSFILFLHSRCSKLYMLFKYFILEQVCIIRHNNFILRKQMLFGLSVCLFFLMNLWSYFWKGICSFNCLMFVPL